MLNPGGEIEAYIAWGAPASGTSQSDDGLAADALKSGQAVRGGYLPMPYPAPANISIHNTELSTACGKPTQDDITSAITPCSPVLSSPFGQLMVDFNVSGTTWVTAVNTSGAALRLDGLRLCTESSCLPIKLAENLQPGEIIAVSLGADATKPETATYKFHAEATQVLNPNEFAIALVVPGSGASFTPNDVLAVAHGTGVTAPWTVVRP